MIYAIYPGTVTTRDGEVLTFSYEELIALYGVSEEDCVLGPAVLQRELMNYILLKPRVDNIYTNINDLIELGDEIVWGPDFDGRKRWTQETNFDTMYREQLAEKQLPG